MKILIIFICTFFTIISLLAQTSGELSLSVTTGNAGGGFAPKNIVAVWIEDESESFVKTLYAYTGSYKTHLNIWETSSGFNTTDAITGATYTGHTTRTYVWDGKNTAGELMSDGNYRLRIELTDKNATGNYSTYSFVKGIESQSLNPSNQPSFSNVSINWIPEISDIATKRNGEALLITPNPSSGVIFIKGKMTTIDISNKPQGLYIVKVADDNGSYTRKILKQ